MPLPILDQFLLDAVYIQVVGPERVATQARETARANYRSYRADWMEAHRAHKPAVPAPEPDDINDFVPALFRRFRTNYSEAYTELVYPGPMARDTVHTLFVQVDEPALATKVGAMTTPTNNALRFYHFLSQPTKTIVTPGYKRSKNADGSTTQRCHQ